MKTLKLLFVALFATLLLVSCEKDEDGNRIRYYKCNGEGHIFYRLPNGNLVPFSEGKVEIKNWVRNGDWVVGNPLHHFDYVNTNCNGYYSCKFAKTINKENVVKYYISPDYQTVINQTPDGYKWLLYTDVMVFGFLSFCPNDFEPESEKYKIDTIFLPLEKL